MDISLARLQQLFDGFYRSADLCEWAEERLGLGLLSNRNRARRRGGDLWGRNRLEAGIRITLQEPVADRRGDSKEQETGKGPRLL